MGPLLTCSSSAPCLGALSQATCQIIPRVWVFLAILGKQFACLMTKDLSPIGGPKSLKTLLVLQVKCQEVVMQYNNSNLCRPKNMFSKQSFN